MVAQEQARVPEILPPARHGFYQRMVQQYGTPLMLLDASVVRQQYQALSEALPGVTLHYAVKAFPNPELLQLLNESGSSFDLASAGEVALVQELGIDPERCIQTHPVKRREDIVSCLEYGCSTFVFDHAGELDKLHPWRDQVNLMLRLSFRNPYTRVDLSKKFGCELEAALPLLRKAKAMGLKVSGLCFHVGSQVIHPGRYVDAINHCRELIEQAAAEGMPLEVLDIGGGFPVPYDAPLPAISEFCRPIREALSLLPQEMKVIAEPGRFLAAEAVTAVCSVMGVAKREGRWWHYLDDGVYGSYSGILFDHTRFPLSVLKQGPLEPAVLTGPTCDSNDIVDENIMMPVLEEGDLVIGRYMGAYTSASATDFNYFPRARVVRVDYSPAAVTGSQSEAVRCGASVA
ncbi:type III PLP-dependent enzyme [Spongorhabdus nitratireducens]